MHGCSIARFGNRIFSALCLADCCIGPTLEELYELHVRCRRNILSGFAHLSPDCFAQAGEILMTMYGIAQIVFYFVVLLGLAKPLGWYMARVYEGRPCGADKIFSPVERLIYRLCAV